MTTKCLKHFRTYTTFAVSGFQMARFSQIVLLKDLIMRHLFYFYILYFCPTLRTLLSYAFLLLPSSAFAFLTTELGKVEVSRFKILSLSWFGSNWFGANVN